MQYLNKKIVEPTQNVPLEGIEVVFFEMQAGRALSFKQGAYTVTIMRQSVLTLLNLFEVVLNVYETLNEKLPLVEKKIHYFTENIHSNDKSFTIQNKIEKLHQFNKKDLIDLELHALAFEDLLTIRKLNDTELQPFQRN